LTWLTEPEPV